jgi:hypothetical protein
MTPYGIPADRYHCLLDEQPYYLVPTRLLKPDEGGELILNPKCWFSWRGPPPDNLATPDLADDTFLRPDSVVWVPDSATGAIWPYWAGPEYVRLLAQMARGQPVSASLSRHVRWVLANADILVSHDHAERKRSEWLHYGRFRAVDFRKGFVVVPHLIPPFHLGALRRYYRHTIRTSHIRLGDDQVGRRYAAHNEPVARHVHKQLVQAVADIAGATVKLSYAYFVAYQSGATLERHTDRAQCEYSITLLIDSTPEPLEQSPWPIKLVTPRGAVGVWQYLGEALLYRGRRLPHYRDRLPAGCTSTSLLLHYVDEGFAGPLS